MNGEFSIFINTLSLVITEQTVSAFCINVFPCPKDCSHFPIVHAVHEFIFYCPPFSSNNAGRKVSNLSSAAWKNIGLHVGLYRKIGYPSDDRDLSFLCTNQAKSGATWSQWVKRLFTFHLLLMRWFAEWEIALDGMNLHVAVGSSYNTFLCFYWLRCKQ